jgi:hypothetical protein
MSTKNDYMLLFVGHEWYKDVSETEIKKVAEQAKAWFENLVAQGKMKDAHALIRSGTRVAGRTGKVISDGPYAETKEAVGGYLILQAVSLDEAVAIAKTNPTIPYGTSIEVREMTDDCPLFRIIRSLDQQLAAA